MSNAVSALSNASWSDGIAEIREIGPQGMITLRGDLAAAPVKKAVKAATGTAMPKPLSILTDGDSASAWMSPDELLLLCPYEHVADNLAAMTKALGKAHGLAVDVSDARALFEVQGAHARDVLAKLAPIDASADALVDGQIRRTRLAQVPAAVWVNGDVVRVICFRSVAQYMFDLLKTAGQPGSEVNFHA